MTIAAAAHRLNVVTTNFDWDDRYNLWSGIIGGAFLALAYFGTDQSQVQRYLSGQSVEDSRRGLYLNAVAKIPMQLFILFIGVHGLRLLHLPAAARHVPADWTRHASKRRSAREQYRPDQGAIRRGVRAAEERRAAARDDGGTADAAAATARSATSVPRKSSSMPPGGTPRSWRAESGGSGATDTNYIFLTFVTGHLPAGIVGLVLAVILGATMTSISGEMSALATVTVVDVYRRHVHASAQRPPLPARGAARHACSGAPTPSSARSSCKGIGSLVEVVNVLGSLFYGSMLGVFVLAFFFRA